MVQEDCQHSTMSLSKSCFSFKKSLGNFIFEYETPKIVTIRSVRVGLINRFLQLAIISYIVGYAIIFTKGYQEKDAGLSTVMSKVKGISSSLSRDDLAETYRRVWDTADYIIPPMLKDSVFITTNAIITKGQSIGNCPEDPWAGKDAKCDPTVENVCEKNGRLKFGIGNGILTGECVKSDRIKNYTCEVNTWCPIENDYQGDSFRKPLLAEVENFTMFVKNTVEFPKFRAKRRNIDSIKDPNYVKKCVYHPINEPKCPIMKIGDMVRLANANMTELAIYGGVINVLITWTCDLDYNIDVCNPTYTFSQMDESKGGFSPGHNFRYAYYYRENDTLYRDLIKAYGVLFLFNVKAQAGQFSIVQLGLNIGAGLALLGITSVLMDMIVFHIGQDRQYYRQQKFVTVTESQCRRHKQLAPVHQTLIGAAIPTDIDDKQTEYYTNTRPLVRTDNTFPTSTTSLNSAISASANLVKKPVFVGDGLDIREIDGDDIDD